MKKIVVILLIGMLCISVRAKSNEPTYKIISHSFRRRKILNKCMI